MVRAALLALSVFSLAVSAPAFADYDPELEAQEAAARAAQQAEANRKHAEAQAARNAAEVDAYKKFLGKEADGKSDAEVRALYAARIEQAKADSVAKQAEAMKLFGDAQKSNPAADQLMKQHVGKSFADIQKMSPEQLEAFAAQMEKQHLQGLGAGTAE